MDDLTPLRSEVATSGDLRSCHSTTVGDYVIEGHVPAKEILPLPADRPAATGLAVADMPVGFPGVGTTGLSERFDVVFFGPGEREVYARYQRIHRLR